MQKGIGKAKQAFDKAFHQMTVLKAREVHSSNAQGMRGQDKKDRRANLVMAHRRVMEIDHGNPLRGYPSAQTRAHRSESQITHGGVCLTRLVPGKVQSGLSRRERTKLVLEYGSSLERFGVIHSRIYKSNVTKPLHQSPSKIEEDAGEMPRPLEIGSQSKDRPIGYRVRVLGHDAFLRDTIFHGIEMKSNMVEKLSRQRVGFPCWVQRSVPLNKALEEGFFELNEREGGSIRPLDDGMMGPFIFHAKESDTKPSVSLLKSLLS
jgi:hypothetical protein